MAKVAVVGGAGHLGHAIAKRLFKAGHEVSIGSRPPASAAKAAAAMGEGVGSRTNAEVAAVGAFVKTFQPTERVSGSPG